MTEDSRPAAIRETVTARTRRLLALLPHLRRGERLSISRLATLVGSAPERVHDDLWELMFCGIPPYDPGSLIDLDIGEDTITVINEPPGLTQPVRFTHAECRALAMALQEAGFSAESDLVTRVLSAAATTVSAEEIRRTLLAGSAATGGRPGDMSVGDVYALLAGASERCEKVDIIYHTGAVGCASHRRIRPKALSNRYGVCYVTAFCELATERRTFRLDRIQEAALTGEVFERSDEPGPADVVPDVSRLPVATVRFAPGAAVPDSHDWPGRTIAGTDADGRVTITVPYQGEQWVARQVVSYLGQAEVLAPAEVREAVRALGEHLLAELAPPPGAGD